MMPLPRLRSPLLTHAIQCLRLRLDAPWPLRKWRRALRLVGTESPQIGTPPAP